MPGATPMPWKAEPLGLPSEEGSRQARSMKHTAPTYGRAIFNAVIGRRSGPNTDIFWAEPDAAALRWPSEVRTPEVKSSPRQIRVF